MKQINNKTKILIVGLGLIGGSYAKALTKKGYKVRAITLDSSDIEYAIDKGFLEDGTTAVTREYLAWADVIVFSLYPHTFIEWLKKYGSMIKKRNALHRRNGCQKLYSFGCAGAYARGRRVHCGSPDGRP